MRPVVEPFEAGDRSQERRLAAPARAQQCHDLTGSDVDRDLLEYLDGTEPLDGVDDVDASFVRHGRQVIGASSDGPGGTVNGVSRCEGGIAFG